MRAFVAIMRWYKAVAIAATAVLGGPALAGETELDKPNIIFILVDDLRFDGFGAINSALKTPNIDRLAKEGVLYRNAFVTTSLCSPSRATILTGHSTRNHGIVGNEVPEPEGTVFFPSYLQKAGYRTAMIGKWHMGHGDQPRPGFDRWVSFPGQGVYLPSQAEGDEASFNIDGQRVPQKGYITDELTDYAIDWLGEDKGNGKGADQPFFLYLSHKGVHENFTPAERHKNLYRDFQVTVPASAKPVDDSPTPRWVTTQRNSWHGLDYAYYGEKDLILMQRDYYATLTAIDESIGRIFRHLRKHNVDRNTVIFFMGDNGFLFGEHGLIDKRNAYEESMRVPLMVWGSKYLPKGKVEEAMVTNLDIAPTMLDLAGSPAPSDFEGRSLLELNHSETTAPWRNHFIYEYYWEFALPHTPTTFAIRTDRYKYITYHGLWDVDELFDLKADPDERHNLIFDPAMAKVRNELRARLFDEIVNRRGDRVIPFSPKNRDGRIYRDRDGPEPGVFPDQWLRDREGSGVSTDRH